MNNDLEAGTLFRVREETGAHTLHIEPLPYSLEEA